jgi:2-dehydro-3-deoxyphosphooctonate aldolase (KDO 8-P synthase)
MSYPVKLTDIRNDQPHPLMLIAGPCVLESEALAFQIAETIKTIVEKHDLFFVFKASFDKANRTAGTSTRGPGIDEGLEILARIRDELNVPVTTDVHDISQVDTVSAVVDMIQIPAFLCRQTDLLLAAGNSGKSVNVKKGQFMAPEDMDYAVAKVKQGGGQNVFLTERGASFGYRNLVVDIRSLPIMRNSAPVIFDGTHSVQMPGGAGGKTGGKREMVPVLVRSALAAGVDGLFLEVHPDPDSSPSDGPNMITPETLSAHLPQWLELYKLAGETPATNSGDVA